MTQNGGTRDERLRLIRHILRTAEVTSQEDLARRLEREGHAVTQSSISRDLREAGISKVRGRYHVPGEDAGATGRLAAVMAELIRSTAAAGPHLLVVHTAVGAASRVALAIDQASWPEIVGTLAGDDTVFVAVAGEAARRRVVKKLQRDAREDGHA